MCAMSRGCPRRTERGACDHRLFEVTADDACRVSASVSTTARAMALTRIFSRPEFRGQHARNRVHRRPFVADIDRSPRDRGLLATELILMTLPPFRFQNTAPPLWSARIVPAHLVLKWRWNSSSVMSSSGWN